MTVLSRPELWWRVAIVACGYTGFQMDQHRFAYYTNQSNLIVLGYFGATIYWMLKRGTTAPAAPRLRGPVTLWIVITCLISHFVLNHGDNPLPGLIHGDPATELTNRSLFLMHYAVPIMVLLDWLLFGPRRVSPWRDLPLWLIYPFGYGITSIFRAILFPEVPDRYPYFFFSPEGKGYLGVALWMVALLALFALLGAALLALDRLLAALPRRTATATPATPGPTGEHGRTGAVDGKAGPVTGPRSGSPSPTARG
ncbi:hypothetical protein GCM10010435_79340 [Winogradskya consettensis]|uniref:Integral membrane regulator n=1 Tax=Winogradskya consettensis TaxID=113560 RepID=A0A919SUX4_9ACTN|nr:Pr6Pr family membrane protein [Actinoplanes consettensis]GIM77493.1 hypothetical protein Aco04nite_55620 [Actinoplanes consettensis]